MIYLLRTRQYLSFPFHCNILWLSLEEGEETTLFWRSVMDQSVCWGFSLMVYHVDPQSSLNVIFVTQMMKLDLRGSLNFLLGNGQYFAIYLTLLLSFSSITRSCSLLNPFSLCFDSLCLFLLEILCFSFCCHKCLESPSSYHSLFYLFKKLPILEWIRWEKSNHFCETSVFSYIDCTQTTKYRNWRPRKYFSHPLIAAAVNTTNKWNKSL